MENNLGVRITANAEGVAPGVNVAKGELGSLEATVAALNTTMATVGKQMTEAFTGGARAATGATQAIKATHAATEEETTALGRMIAKVHEGAESVRTFQMRAKEFAEVYVAMFAVEQIAEFINKMGEAAEKVEHLSQQFGMSVKEVQQLQGVAKATGIPVEALTKGMGLLDRNMANAAMGSKNLKQALDAVGVSINDGRSQMEKLAVVADKFHDMEDGPKKAALAMQLFGRSGRDLIPVLNLGSAGINALNEKMNEYGVVNEGTVEKGVALAESVNETKLGMTGLWNVLTDALAPTFKIMVEGVNELIKAFIQSYEQGGIVATIFTALSTIVQEFIAVIEAVAEVFGAIWDVISEVMSDIGQIFSDIFGVKVPSYTNYSKFVLNEFKDIVTIVKDSIMIDLEVIGAAFRILMQVVITFGKIAWDALTLNWGAIAGDWNTGMGRVVNIVHDAANKIKRDAAEMAAAIQAAAHGEALPSKGGGIELPKGLGSGFDYTPHPTGGAKKAKKEKKPEDDRLDLWKQQLADMLNAEENWGVDENAFSMQFWQHKLDTEKLSAKQIIEIRRTMAQEKKAIFKEEQQAEIDDLKKTETIRLDDAKTQTSLQKDVLNDKLQMIDEAEKRGQLSTIKALQQRNQVNRQLLDLDRQEADEEYRIKLKTLQDELLLEHLKPNERKKINDQILVLERQHYNQMEQLNAQYNSKIKAQNAAVVDAYIAKWKGIVAPVTSALGGMFQSLYNRQMGFKQAAIQAMDSIVMSWAQKGIEALGNWVATQLGMRAANTATKTADTAETTTTNAVKLVSTQTTNMGQILSEAPVAAAAAFASTAAIPIVGPALAPGAAAAAYAAVAGMAPLAFAEQGFDVPWGQNPITQLHQEEMVLPAHLANPMRDLLTGGFMLRGGGDRAAAAGRSAGENGRSEYNDNRGDTHLHHSPTYPAPPRDIDMGELLQKEGDRMIRFFNRARRDGKIG